MTTIAQAKKLTRPLIERNASLVLVGRMIVMRPVQHVLRSIYIDRTRDAARFRPFWLVMHLFDPVRSVWFNLGGQIYKPELTSWSKEFPKLWWMLDPESPELLAKIVENEVLPAMAPLGQLKPFVEHMASVKDHAYHLRLLEKVIVDVALGHLDDARAICRDMISKMTAENWARDEDDKARLGRLQQLCRLLAADDRAGLAALLHEWEAITVRNLKVEHLWERTPFPLEQA